MNEETATHGDFFPSINQFRSVVKAERDWAAYHNVEPRKRLFMGTVKLHGTNAGISVLEDGGIIYRSRSREITPDDDNYGFARDMSQFTDIILDCIPCGVTVFGEWCGQGIQAGVAVSQEPKMFVAFAARRGAEWLDVAEIGRNKGARIFNISDYQSWIEEIDFAAPEQSQNKLISLTEAVENQCPVGASFGHEGIGEGIVWVPIDGDRDDRFWFKVKGEKHSVTKVKTLAAIDVERFAARDELVSSILAENRMRQGLDIHINEMKKPLDMKSIGYYLRWVFADVLKEEADTISASGFEVKELGKPISDIAKRFYINAVNSKDGF